MPAKGQRSGYFIKCEFCGKEVYKTKSQYAKAEHHFCSNKCQKDLLRIMTYEYRDCEICGKQMYLPKKSTQRFCSINCQKEWQKTNIGEKNPKCTRVWQECDVCGKKYLMQKYKIDKFDNHFCSNECRRYWYANDWSQREEWKEEARERTLRMFEHGEMPTTNTKPQLIVNDILKEMRIKYKNEARYGHYMFDNKLINYNLLIEVNGDYWHVNPNRFPADKINNMQEKNIRRDKIKHNYVSYWFNIEPLYLWENEITKDRTLCKLLIKHYIDNKGVIENYNSFNYVVNENNELELKDNIVIAYSEE